MSSFEYVQCVYVCVILSAVARAISKGFCCLIGMLTGEVTPSKQRGDPGMLQFKIREFAGECFPEMFCGWAEPSGMKVHLPCLCDIECMCQSWLNPF